MYILESNCTYHVLIITQFFISCFDNNEYVNIMSKAEGTCPVHVRIRINVFRLELICPNHVLMKTDLSKLCLDLSKSCLDRNRSV